MADGADLDAALQRGPRGAHRRTPATERVVRTLLAIPGCKHQHVADALGIGLTAAYKHYPDLLKGEGDGKSFIATSQQRGLVAQYKAAGLKHAEIADLLGISRATLERHFPQELSTGKAKTVALVANRVIARALGTGVEAQRAAEFYLNCQAKWTPGSKLGVEREEEPPMVDGAPERQLTRADARRVAFLLSRARLEPPQQALIVHPDPEGEGPAR